MHLCQRFFQSSIFVLSFIDMNPKYKNYLPESSDLSSLLPILLKFVLLKEFLEVGQP